MKYPGNLVAVLLGVAALGAMISTVPDYNSSFQPFAVFADEDGIGRGRQFTAELVELKTADRISYTQFGQDISRDTSATFLVAELSVTGQSESRQLQAVWLGATGRQYSQTARLDDAPRSLSIARFEPDLTDRTVAVFELPEDEIVGGRLGLFPRGSAIMDSAVHFPPPKTVPKSRETLRLEP